MAKVLLLLILTVIYEGAAQTNDCDHIDQDLKDGDVEFVASGSFTDSQKEIDVYFKMDDVNLKDVRINLQERNGNQQSDLFPFDDGCSQHGNHSEWRMLKVSYTTDSIRVSVSTENYSCQSRCFISSPWQLPLDLCVIAYGPSQWLWKWSSNCSPTFKTFNGTSKYSTLSTCIAPKTTLFKAMVVMIVLSVMALVLLASVVLIVWWKKQRHQHPGTQKEQIYDTFTFQRTRGDQSGAKRGAVRNGSKKATESALYENLNLYDDVAAVRPESAVYVNAPLYDDVVSA